MKNLKLLHNVLFASMILWLPSCTNLYYPNSINAPAFSKKGQVVVNAGAGNKAANVQLAVAVTEETAIMFNYNWGKYDLKYSYPAFIKGEQIIFTHAEGHHHTFMEAGAGFFKARNKTHRYEAFALLGYGNSNSYTNEFTKKGDYFRFAIQNDLGFETKALEGIFSVRAGYLSMKGEKSNEGKFNQGSCFLDPAFTLRTGWKQIKINAQVGVNFPFDFGFNEDIEGWINVGMQLKF
jgi:hypothetical protein